MSDSSDARKREERQDMFGKLNLWFMERELENRKGALANGTMDDEGLRHVVRMLLADYCAAKLLAPHLFDDALLERLEDRFHRDADRLRRWGFHGIWSQLDRQLSESDQEQRYAVGGALESLGQVWATGKGRLMAVELGLKKSPPVPRSEAGPARLKKERETIMHSEFGDLSRSKLDSLY